MKSPARVELELRRERRRLAALERRIEEGRRLAAALVEWRARCRALGFRIGLEFWPR